jgi:amino acid transporter
LVRKHLFLIYSLLIISSIYTLGPISQVLSTPIALLTGQVFVDLFYSATNSLTATNIMTAIIIINFTTAAISILAAASRQLWAFARNNGLPFSKLIAPVRTINSTFPHV